MKLYGVLADAIVAVHFAYVAVVVGGMAAILLGIVRRWSWVRNFWFRTVHLLMIAVVAFESLLGITCPLTDWEDSLREASGSPIEHGSFIGRWAHDLLFIDVPPWTMTVCYVAFGLAVLSVFLLAPPRWPRRRRERDQRQAANPQFSPRCAPAKGVACVLALHCGGSIMVQHVSRGRRLTCRPVRTTTVWVSKASHL